MPLWSWTWFCRALNALRSVVKYFVGYFWGWIFTKPGLDAEMDNFLLSHHFHLLHYNLFGSVAVGEFKFGNHWFIYLLFTDFNSGKLLSCEGDLFGKPCYFALISLYQVKTKELLKSLFWYLVILCDVLWYLVILCDVLWYLVIPCDAVLVRLRALKPCTNTKIHEPNLWPRMISLW